MTHIFVQLWWAQAQACILALNPLPGCCVPLHVKLRLWSAISNPVNAVYFHQVTSSSPALGLLTSAFWCITGSAWRAQD